MVADPPRAVKVDEALARIMREQMRTLTPPLSLSEGEGAISMPSTARAAPDASARPRSPDAGSAPHDEVGLDERADQVSR